MFLLSITESNNKELVIEIELIIT